jgi:hypothetical protein
VAPAYSGFWAASSLVAVVFFISFLSGELPSPQR